MKTPNERVRERQRDTRRETLATAFHCAPHQTLRRAPPSITWKVTCFHFEPRTIALSSTDAHGNAQTYMHTYQEKVTTHRVTEVGQVGVVQRGRAKGSKGCTPAPGKIRGRITCSWIVA